MKLQGQTLSAFRLDLPPDVEWHGLGRRRHRGECHLFNELEVSSRIDQRSVLDNTTVLCGEPVPVVPEAVQVHESLNSRILRFIGSSPFRRQGCQEPRLYLLDERTSAVVVSQIRMHGPVAIQLQRLPPLLVGVTVHDLSDLAENVNDLPFRGNRLDEFCTELPKNVVSHRNNRTSA